MTGLNGAGYTSWNPYLSCSFVDNPDTDSSPGESIVANKLLAYAFILSAEGYPFIYGKDYFGGDVWKGAYGLKPWIDNLVWIHENLAFGATVTRYLSDVAIVLNRTGYPGLLTALNFDTMNACAITCKTSFGPNVRLKDYTGKHPDIWTDAQGRASFTVPSNGYQSGRSYLCFSLPGYAAVFEPKPRSTTQTFFGADDLDLPAMRNGAANVARVYARPNSNMSAVLALNDDAWKRGASIVLEAVGQDEHVLGRKTITYGEPNTALVVHTGRGGWQTFRTTTSGLSGVAPFELSVTYMGTQRLSDI